MKATHVGIESEIKREAQRAAKAKKDAAKADQKKTRKHHKKLGRDNPERVDEQPVERVKL